MTAQQYINRLRNFHKREYAKAYLRFLLEGGEEPNYQTSYMAAQAIRMTLRELTCVS